MPNKLPRPKRKKTPIQIKLPYFDMILSRLEAGDPEFQEAFHRHVHFGAWEHPEHAYDNIPDSIRAMDRLCQYLLTVADIHSGQRVLDVGCGFGGTLATLNEQFDSLELTGLNIDARQLEVARDRLVARPSNSLRLVEGDACQMPFEGDSFDRILAVECIFHFPSRRAFFEHARRVLRSGGNLTLSDFLLPDGSPPGNFDDPSNPLWGSYTAIDLPGYRALAAEVGLELTHAQDISRNVRPTYHYFGQLLGRHFPEALQATELGAFIMDAGGIAYCTLRFDLPTRNQGQPPQLQR